MFQLITLLAAAGLSSILLAFAHAYNWERIFARKVESPWSHVAGVLWLAVPFSALMIVWGHWWCLAAAAAVAVGGGLPVLFGYRIRHEVEKREREVVLSEALDDERQVSHIIRRRMMELERENADLIARVCASGENGDGAEQS